MRGGKKAHKQGRGPEGDFKIYWNRAWKPVWNRKNFDKMKRAARHINRTQVAERINGKVGYVYIFKNGYENLYKIGYAGDWEKRLKGFQAGNPSLSYIYAGRVFNARLVESALHSRFRTFRYSREFYELEGPQIAAIKRFIDENKPVGFVPSWLESKKDNSDAEMQEAADDIN